jgi:hypothetical protein
MQVRCQDSHDLFLKHAADYFDSVEDISEEVYGIQGCGWGRGVECFVFRMVGGKLKLNLDAHYLQKEKEKEGQKGERKKGEGEMSADVGAGGCTDGGVDLKHEPLKNKKNKKKRRDGSCGHVDGSAVEKKARTDR